MKVFCNCAGCQNLGNWPLRKFDPDVLRFVFCEQTVKLFRGKIPLCPVCAFHLYGALERLYPGITDGIKPVKAVPLKVVGGAGGN